MSDIRKTTLEDLKAKLRKVKSIGKVKGLILAGCKEQRAYIQVCSDATVYNLWEALLCLEGYEYDGFFTLGTAQACIDKLTPKQKAKG